MSTPSLPYVAHGARRRTAKGAGWQRAVADLLTTWGGLYRRVWAKPIAAHYERVLRTSAPLPKARAEEVARKSIMREFWASPFGTTATRLFEAFTERGCNQYARWVQAVIWEERAEPPTSTPAGEAVALRAVLHALDWLPDYETYPFNVKQSRGNGMREWVTADRQPFEEAHSRAFRLTGARLDALEADGAPMTAGRGETRLSKDEREVMVRNYLKAHRSRAEKGEVSIREV
jgi:hypothetical protein